MTDYVKAGIGTLFLALTLGAMGEVMIWGILSMLHASLLIILSGETLGLIILLVLSVPVYQLILRNERTYGLTAAAEEPENVGSSSERLKGLKPTAFV